MPEFNDIPPAGDPDDAQTAYLIDVGFLIFEGEHEFEAYNGVYDGKYGYYDDGQYYSLSRQKALYDAETFLEQNGDRAYAIVVDTWIPGFFTQEDLDNGYGPDVEGEPYIVEDAIFAKARINGVIVDLFQ